ncbi:MAG: Ig-like domain-containing protein [Gemmatimonadales bacterium]
MLLAAALVVVAVACHKDSPASPPTPARVTPTQGSDAQIGMVGQRLPLPVTVRVLNASGSPVRGVTVAWTILAGGGSLDVGTSTTDSTGDALVNWTLGTVTRLDSLQASVGSSLSVVVVATAQAGAVASLKKVSGDQQTLPRGTTSAPFIVQAFDQYGNVVSNAAITWSAQNGGLLSAAQTMTDSSGRTAVTLTTDPAPATYTIVAQAGSLRVTFVATGS